MPGSRSKTRKAHRGPRFAEDPDRRVKYVLRRRRRGPDEQVEQVLVRRARRSRAKDVAPQARQLTVRQQRRRSRHATGAALREHTKVLTVDPRRPFEPPV